MSMSMTRKMVLGAAIAAGSPLVAALAPASAHGRHRHHFGFSAPIVVAPSYVATCDYF